MYINYIIMISKIKPVFRNRVAKYLILNIFEKDAEIDEKRRKKKPLETMFPGVLQYFSEINAWRTGSLFSPS